MGIYNVGGQTDEAGAAKNDSRLKELLNGGTS
jgi:hypothetical protein